MSPAHPGDLPLEAGLLCRCLSCCCPRGGGHRSRAYREWAAALDRWEEAHGRGSGPTPGAD